MGLRPSVPVTMPDVPSAWLGCEHCYSEGRLVGRWYPVTGIGDVTPEGLHGHATSHEEVVCMDTDGLPTTGEPSQEAAARWGEIYTAVGDEQWPALCAWVRSGSYIAEGNTDYPALGDFEEAYCGEWGSFRDYAFQLADDIALFGGLPDDHVAVRYFDWDSWIRDLAMDHGVEPCDTGGVFIFRSL